MKKPLLFTSLALSTTLFAQTTLADPAYDNAAFEDGLSANAQLLAGYYQARGADVISKDNEDLNNLEDKTPAFDAPFLLPAVDLSYRFNQGANSVYLGSNTQTGAQVIYQTRLGITQYLYSGVELDFSISPAFLGNEQNVWQDPFATNLKTISGKTISRRDKTLASSDGFNIEARYLMDGKLSAGYQFNKVKIKNEYSGRTLANLNESQRQQLRRDHTSHRVYSEFTQPISASSYFISALSLNQQTAKGDSFDQLTPAITLTLYSYLQNAEYFVSAAYQDTDFENKHVVFNKRRNDKVYSFTGGISFPQVLPMKHWNLDLLASVGKNQSNINFYDNNFTFLAAGISREF